MNELSCLFEQIFHSERNFKARVDHLKALNGKIQECEMKLELAMEELHTKRGELAVKNSKLADVEMEVKLLQLRKAILTSQNEDTRQEKIKASQDYQTLLGDLTAIQQVFKGKLIEFGRRYDLHGSGLKYKEEEDKKKIMVLQDELILLETEIVEVESYLEDVNKLQEKLKGAENELDCEREKGKELQAIKSEQETEILGLKDKKTSKTNDSDLSRLQAELDACKNSPEEQNCQELSKELSDLQRKCYHKQMKLQTARQSRIVPLSTNQHSTQKPDHSGDCNEAEVINLVNDEAEIINLVDDEWMETGAFDKFDGDDDDDDVFVEDEWDLDEMDRNVNQCYSSVGFEQTREEFCTISQRKNFPSTLNSYGSTSKCSVASINFQSANARGKKGQRHENSPVPHSKPSKSFSMTPRGSIENCKDDQAAVWSPFLTRKRPGESIFKTSKAQIQNSPKRQKKVRFQY